MPRLARATWDAQESIEFLKTDGYQAQRRPLVGRRLLRPLRASRAITRTTRRSAATSRRSAAGRKRPASTRSRFTRASSRRRSTAISITRRSSARRNGFLKELGMSVTGVQHQHLDQPEVPARRPVQSGSGAAPRRARGDPEGARDLQDAEDHGPQRLAGIRRRRLSLPDRLQAVDRVVHRGADHASTRNASSTASSSASSRSRTSRASCS